MIHEYKIEEGIPIPERPGRNRKDHPFNTMKIGDSFIVELPDPSKSEGVKNSIYVLARTRGLKIAIRKIDNDTLRVWRVDPSEKRK